MLLDRIACLSHGIAVICLCKHGNIILIIAERHCFRRRNLQKRLNIGKCIALADLLAHHIHPDISGNDNFIFCPERFLQSSIDLFQRTIHRTKGDFDDWVRHGIQFCIRDCRKLHIKVGNFLLKLRFRSLWVINSIHPAQNRNNRRQFLTEV